MKMIIKIILIMYILSLFCHKSGDSITIANDKKYLDKYECESAAASLVNDGLDISIHDCANEIYAHARIYYLLNSDRWKSIAASLRDIDLQDGGDTPQRKLLYEVIWIGDELWQSM